MTVTVLVDNDVVIKLARMDAYLDALSGLGLTTQQVGSLKPMLRYMGIYSAEKRLRLTDSAAEASRLGAVLQSIVEIEMTASESQLAAQVMKAVLSAGLDIQDGELALCVVAVSRGQLDFCTADKRALKDLHRLEALWAGLGQLRGRCVCFEQVFGALCVKFGLPRVRKAVQTCSTTDLSITNIYRRSAGEGEHAFLLGLQQAIEDKIARHAPGWLKGHR